jgi:hypothetical protein
MLKSTVNGLKPLTQTVPGGITVVISLLLPLRHLKVLSDHRVTVSA